MKVLQSAFMSLLLMTVMLFLVPIDAYSTVHQIAMQDFFFSPRNTVVSPGDTVRWSNSSLAPHTSTGDTRIWSSGVVNPGASYSRQFLTPGVFAYQCSIHVLMGMRDTIHVSSVGIDDPQSAIPSAYELAQNYPNPFNAQTTIQYDLPSDADVTITVFDILGQKLETLVDEHQDAGHHQIAWDAADQPSGIYFYKIQAGDFSQTKRATLLK